MHGQIHDCLRLMILELYGQEKWDNILLKSNTTDDEHYLKLRHYSDTLTLSLLSTAALVLGLSLDEMLIAYGKYFIKYTLDMGYDTMLKSLGPNIRCFIENLDTVHTLLAVSYHNIVPPIFRCESLEDGNLMLHYYSYRDNLEMLVVGLLLGSAEIIYNSTVDVSVVNTSHFYVSDTETLFHATLLVKLPPSIQSTSTMARQIQGDITQLLHGNGQKCPFSAPSGNMAPVNTKKHHTFINAQHARFDGSQSSRAHQEDGGVVSQKLCQAPSVDVERFCLYFPYHLIFDRNMVIKQYGQQMPALCPHLRVGAVITDICDITYPRLPFLFNACLEFFNSLFVLKILPRNGYPEMYLKGQMLLISADHIMYICSPKLRNLEELRQRKFYIADLPVYDATREFVLLNQLRKAELDISIRLEETTAKLLQTSAALEREKAKTDMLLHEMLPVKVAAELREGRQVQAEKHDDATILFSDIVTFTSIASSVQPMDIVLLLNSLYSKFDKLSGDHDVYKVETIGDAYMVVGGVPERNRRHAQNVTDMALDMVRAAHTVLCPSKKTPIEIRVGLHTGPVVSGVVGEKMPRYCLFGDTVNTASRMESHGLPGHIHVSHQTYRELTEEEYIIQERGRIKVKGKGKMSTYFVLAKRNESQVAFGQRSRSSECIDDSSTSASTDVTEENPPSSVCTIV